jgi:2-polyprenyl-3-methyl-5-hydroxy-6-metoxy-1,4-benzoquinol methylase
MFCPICNALPVQAWQVAKSGDGNEKRYTLARCGSCAAIFDHRIQTINNVTDESMQVLVNHDYYRQEFSESEYAEKYKINQGMLGGFVHFFKGRKVYVEIGVGLGFLSRAAAAIFDRSYGLDLEVATAIATGPVPENVEFQVHAKFLSDYNGQISALCAWHVVEHLADPHRVLAPLLHMVEQSGVFFGQVPLYKEDYVFDAHYIFHSEKSLICLLAAYGFVPVYFQRDEQNHFLSFCFRKS